MAKQNQRNTHSARHLRVGSWKASLFPASAYQVEYVASHAAHTIRYLLLQPHFVDSLLFDYHANRLADSVRTHSGVQLAVTGARGSMTESRLCIIDSLIDRQLGEELTANILAKSVGKSPFDYIIDRRVRRARQ